MENRKVVIKGLIRELHAGADPQKLTQRFGQVIQSLSVADIAEVEEELIREGMPQEEVQRLCEVHLALFRQALEREEVLAPAGHPVNILMEEHRILLRYVQELASIAKRAGEELQAQMARISKIEENLKGAESHFLREENILFPYLEKHGITGPPAIMWTEHNQIREIKKRLYGVLDAYRGPAGGDFARQLAEAAIALSEMLASHIYKENNILFPTAMKVIAAGEWPEIRRGFDELGYCPFTPQPALIEMERVEKPAIKAEAEGLVQFETGMLSLRTLEALLNALPVDITFVDDENTVRYFNEPRGERIFPRAKAIIGRKVQQCHPQKSVHLVNQILDDFRSGRREVAEFWMQTKGRLIHIRYFSVRDISGAYLGCLEVAQDLTDIKALEGEKRLL